MGSIPPARGSDNGANAHVACQPKVGHQRCTAMFKPTGLSSNGANLINDAGQISGQRQSKS